MRFFFCVGILELFGVFKNLYCNLDCNGVCKARRSAGLRLFCHRQTGDQFLHSGGAALLHLVADMGIGLERECRCEMPQVSLYGFDVVTVFDRDRRE